MSGAGPWAAAYTSTGCTGAAASACGGWSCSGEHKTIPDPSGAGAAPGPDGLGGAGGLHLGAAAGGRDRLCRPPRRGPRPGGARRRRRRSAHRLYLLSHDPEVLGLVPAGFNTAGQPEPFAPYTAGLVLLNAVEEMEVHCWGLPRWVQRCHRRRGGCPFPPEVLRRPPTSRPAPGGRRAAPSTLPRGPAR